MDENSGINKPTIKEYKTAFEDGFGSMKAPNYLNKWINFTEFYNDLVMYSNKGKLHKIAKIIDGKE